MIWGKTFKQQEREQENKDMSWFAWYPIQLTNGRWLWWEYVRRFKYESSAWASCFGSYSYQK
jgi:hypothetical protein